MADDLVTPQFFRKTIPALDPLPPGALSYVFNDEIDLHGRTIGPKERLPTGSPRVVPEKEFLTRQSELATVLLPGVVFKTDYKAPLCSFRDLPQVADGLFLAEWAKIGGTVVEIPEYLCQYRLSEFNASSRHSLNLQYFVLDEWRLMETIHSWIDENPLQHALRKARLKCLFAARAEVKRQMFQSSDPAYARDIARTQVQIAGRLATAAGVAAVRGRDMIRRFSSLPSRVEELTQPYR